MSVSYSISSSSGIGLIRTHVILSNGARLVVPISGDATVGQLAAESTRRAVALNIPQSENDTVLYLSDGSILFGEDSLADVMDTSDDPTFFLGSMESLTSSSTALSRSAVSLAWIKNRTNSGSLMDLSQVVSPSVISSIALFKRRSGASESSKIYVRWITAGRALEHRSLKSLPAERTAVPTSTTVAELKEITFKRLYAGNIPAEDRPPSNTTIELFLVNCHLSSLGFG